MTTTVLSKDELLDAQVLRTIGSAPYGGADIGEALAAARKVHGTDLDSWYEVWTALADRLSASAAEAAAAGYQPDGPPCRPGPLSSYYRTAGVMLMAAPLDQRLVESSHRQTATFRQGAELMDQPPEIVEIPYEDTTLPGYFFAVDNDPRPRPTVILTGGYDSTKEEGYFYNAAAALARGYNALVFDGPV